VTVQRDTIIAERMPAGSVQWMRFTVPVSIHNTDVAPVTLAYCGNGIETPENSGWRSVWSPFCLLESTSQITIAPGDTRQIDFDVTAAVAGPGGPEWRNATVEGTYRITIGMIADNSGGRAPVVASNTFVVSNQR
jgi:hypothetical protein